MISPFKFLDSYTKEDRNVFFGRNREIEELYQRVFNGKLLFVYGISGTGKSSLIYCGLANKFQDSDWLPIVIRRGANIVESFKAGIRSFAVTTREDMLPNSTDFRKSVRSLYLDYYKPIFFIFDQFEELFIFGDKEERKEFIQIIKSLVDSDLQCRMIFIMREEYMAWVTEFERYIPTFFENRMRIEKMSHGNAVEVINGPPKTFNIDVEKGFAEALLERLSPGSEEVELTFLQVFLDKIFHLAEAESEKESNSQGFSFTISLLEKTGNVSDLLGNFLDEQVSLMNDPDAAMSVLKAFVSGKGTKRPAHEEEIVENIESTGKEITPGRVRELIHNFVKLRILKDKDDYGRYELRHDSLAEKIYEKFTTTEKELLEVKQFIESSYQSYIKRDLLLSDDDLAYISNKDSLLNLNDDLKKFLEESRKLQKASSKTVRKLIIISSFAFILLLSTIVFFILNKASISKSVYLKESISQFSNPLDQLCLAGASWKSYKGEEASEALLKSFNNAIRNPGQEQILNNLRKKYLIEFKPATKPIEFAKCSEDNRYVYGYSSDSVFIWNRDGRIFSSFSLQNGHPVSLLMSNHGENICAVFQDSTLKVWNSRGNLQFSAKTGYSPLNTDQIFRFSDKDKLVAISPGKGAELIDINGNVLQSFDHQKGSVNSVDISKDGKFIATASSDKTIDVWYLNSDEKRYDLYNCITVHSDTVRSVAFAPNGRYILSTSADGWVKITSINNEEAMSFKDKFEGAYWSDTQLGSPLFCEFDKSGTGIIMKTSSNIKKSDGIFWSAIYVDIYYNLASSGRVFRFDYAQFSPDKKYIAFVAGNNVSLIARIIYKHTNFTVFNNYRLLQMTGQKPFFSPDGKYVYTISGKHPESWYIDLETISDIAVDLYNNWNKYF
jgi:WD40 repeat protein